MSQSLEHQAKMLIDNVSATNYMTGGGTTSGKHKLFLGASLSNKTLTLFYNLGAFHVPDQSEAISMLEEMRVYYRSLFEASELFREFMTDKKVFFELMVFSGQMDFPVALCELSGEIDWKTTLKERNQ